MTVIDNPVLVTYYTGLTVMVIWVLVRLCRPAKRKLMQETCKKHGVPYNATVIGATLSLGILLWPVLMTAAFVIKEKKFD